MANRDLKEMRKQMFSQMEQKLQEMCPSKEERLSSCHPSEDRIVLSHALFWVMSQQLKGKIRQEKFLLMLRQYEEEMLDAFLTEDDDFPDLLRYCNILYETLPVVLNATHDLSKDKDARKLSAIGVVAAGYGGDMPEDLANALLDDIDFHYNKVKCPKIEHHLPQLMKMVEGEIVTML